MHCVQVRPLTTPVLKNYAQQEKYKKIKLTSNSSRSVKKNLIQS